MSVEEVERRRGTALLHALWFVAGFSLVFVLLGAGASAVGHLLRDYQVWLGRLGGVLLVPFGLFPPRLPRPAVPLRRPRTLPAPQTLRYFRPRPGRVPICAARPPRVRPTLR